MMGRMIGKQQASHLAARYKTMKHLQLAINSYDLSFSSSSMGIRGSSSSSKGGSSSSGKGGSSSSSSGVAGGAASLDPFFTTEAGKSLRAWFSSSDNKLLLNQLRQAGIRCCQEDPEAAAAVALPGDKSSSSSTGGGSRGSSSLPQAKPVLQGLTICITGPIAASQFANREQVADFVTELGGQFKNSMTRTTSWLVVSGAGPIENRAVAYFCSRSLSE
jgi:NAD-dependent DNA ligase